MSELIQLGKKIDRPKAPQKEDLQLRFSEQAIHELDRIIEHYPDKKAAALPALWIAQREYDGQLTGEAIAEVAYRLGRTYADIEGVATFYSMYNTHEVNKHKIEVCTCLTCSVCNGYEIYAYLKKKLNIDEHGHSQDGLFTVHEVECLNACDRAPLIQVGDQYHGPVDPAYLDDLIEKLRGQEQSTVVQLANELVKVHLRATENFNSNS
jgi:NADH:ubiquinone oxidoreductase subunit E